MKITLIAPPWIFKEEVEFVSQNLGLRYLASYLQARGHTVVIIDALAEGLNTSFPLHTKYHDVLKWGLSDDDIVRLIPSDTELIGMTAPFTDSKFIVNPLSYAIKKVYPDIMLVMGGVYPSTLPDEAMRDSAVDIVVVGEGEIPIAQIADEKKLEDINGIVFRNGGNFVKTGTVEIVADIDKDIPMPLFDLVPMDKYVRWSPWGNKLDRTVAIFTSRGCPFKCEFCSFYSVFGKWRAFSSERVIREIQISIDKLGIDHIEFMDDNLVLRKDRAMEIFNGIKNLQKVNGKKIAWSAPNGIMINCMDKELVVAMKESGAEIIYLPLESGDEKILKLMNKPHPETHLSKTIEIVRNCVDVGIQASVFVIVGYPGEDRESFEKTLAFCKQLTDIGISAITPLVATPYPNTGLYKLCQKNGWLVYPDMENMLIYQRYSKFLPEFVHIETEWCSRIEAFDRHQEMMQEFPTKHNIRKST
jgi:anaerobic magnesium-protoporphyrin IX monomethyl ester cyclase